LENGFVVVTALDEDTVAIVDVMTAASLAVGFVDGTEVTFDVVTAGVGTSVVVEGIVVA
jgi:hypothetical protein